jgi:hypothetical protein
MTKQILRAKEDRHLSRSSDVKPSRRTVRQFPVVSAKTRRFLAQCAPTRCSTVAKRPLGPVPVELSPADVARELRIPLRQVYRLLETPALNGVRNLATRTIRIPAEELARYQARGR